MTVERQRPAPDGQQPCAACKLPIPIGARVCTHCGNSQTLWGRVAVALKWLGAAATVVSLLIGMNSLYGIYRGQLEKRDAVHEFAAAADRLLENRDYRRAWDMYERAAALDPAAPRVRRGQERLARHWVPDARISGEQRYTDIVDLTLPVLLRGLARSRGAEAADYGALIGWASYLERRERPAQGTDIARTYREALALDPDNTLAHTFLGHWLALEEQDLDAAVRHFARALASAADRGFVRDYQWSAISQLARASAYGSPLNLDARRERLRIVHDMLAAGEPFVAAPGGHDWMPREALAMYGPKWQAESLAQMWPALAAQDHRMLVEALLGEFEADSAAALQGRFVLARVAEELGQGQDALRRYQALEAQVPLTSGLREPLDEALVRLTGAPSRHALLRTDPLAYHTRALLSADPASDAYASALAYLGRAIGRIVDEQRLHESPPVLAALRAASERLAAQVADESDPVNAQTQVLREQHWRLRENLGAVLLAARELDESIAVLQALAREDAPGAGAHAGAQYNLACAFSLRAGTHGDAARQRADIAAGVASLSEAVRSGYDRWEHIRRDPDLDALREDPGYRRIMAGR